MKFMIFVIDQQSRSASTDEMAAIDAFNDSLQQNGNWVSAAGLASPGSALLIDNTESQVLVTKGSLFPGEDFYSGFWIIEADSFESAEQLALQGSFACKRRVEVRPFL